MSLQDLPFEPLTQIFGFLDFRDVMRCSRLCRSFNQSSYFDPYWKLQCKIHWLQDVCPRNFTWRQFFIWHYNDFGPYIDVYGRVLKAWDNIKAFCGLHCPGVLRSLNSGCIERYLDKLEDALGMKLPKDFRCIYRMHNGQKRNPVLGLFGSTDIWGTYTPNRSERMTQIQEIMDFATKCTDTCLGLLPVSSRGYYMDTRDSKWICVSDCCGLEIGQIYQPWDNDLSSDSLKDSGFSVGGESFLDLFERYSESLAKAPTELFQLIPNNSLSRLYHQVWHEASANHVKVLVAAAVNPERRWAQELTSIVTVRCVILSMDSEAPANRSCQLINCWWNTIKGSEHIAQFFDANFIPGGYPLLAPGTVFKYTAQPIQLRQNEEVKGFYKFCYLDTLEEFDIETPSILPPWPDLISCDQRKEKEKEKGRA